MKAQFQKSDGPLSPRGNERFVEPTYVFVTPKMWRTVCAVAKIHGVLPSFMIRNMLMTYLDLSLGNLERFSWTDDRLSAKSRKVHLSLTPSTKKILIQVAEFHGMSTPQIIRMSLHYYFSRHPLTSPDQARARRTETTLSRLNGTQAG